MSKYLAGVLPEVLPRFIGDLWPLLEKIAARSRGKVLPNDILRAIEAGEWQLWGWFDEDRLVGALLTRIVVYPQLKVLEFVGLAGRDRDEWMGHLGIVEGWARSRGCARAEAEGRDGWVPVMAPRGYVKDRVVIAKDF